MSEAELQAQCAFVSNHTAASDYMTEQREQEEMAIHKCKFHNYEHYYVRHTCGHEYCPQYWISCPRCFGTHPENRKEINS